MELRSFVHWVAASHETSSAPLDDLVQEGTLGLLQAIQKFDTTRDTRLTTFAKPWVEGEIRRVVRESSLIPLPAAKAQLLGRFGRAEERLRDVLGREPDVDEVAVELGVSAEEILELSSLTRVLLVDAEPEADQEVGSSGIEGATYSMAEIKALLDTYAEQRGRVEGTTRPSERQLTQSPRSSGPGSSDLQALLLDLEDALDRLPKDAFRVIEVRAFFGLSADEAAQWLDVHPNTARNRFDAAVHLIVDHLNGVRPLGAKTRDGSWADELTPIESLRLVVRKYDEWFATMEAVMASSAAFWQEMELGFVLHEDHGWIPLFSRDIHATIARMGATPRLLSEALGEPAAE